MADTTGQGKLVSTPMSPVLKANALPLDNNSNNNHIEMHNSRFLQSPHCAMKCGQDAFMCKPRTTHQCQCHVVPRDSSAIKFDRVDIAFILALLNWLKPAKGQLSY